MWPSCSRRQTRRRGRGGWRYSRGAGHAGLHEQGPQGEARLARGESCRSQVQRLRGTRGRTWSARSGRACANMFYGIDLARLFVIMGAVGMSRSCLESVIKYARERKQFGKPIGGFQLVQGAVADMAAAIDGVRLQGVPPRVADRQGCAARASRAPTPSIRR